MENINDVKNRIKNKSNKSIKKNEKVVKPNKFKFFAFKFFVVLLVFCFASLACTKDLKLKGMHNFQNVCTALALTKGLVDVEDAVKTIKEFSGVHHRLELVRVLNGVEWYNDSASTSPTRGISALNAFKDKEIVLIAGGADKNLDYTPIGKPIVDGVSSLILIGQTATKIYDAVKKELEAQNKQLDIHWCDTFDQSLETAKRIAKPGQVVLFSPASTSFDMFKDMYDRGDQFRDKVNLMC